MIGALVFSSCETGNVSSRALPAYESPLAKTDFQHVRTTAYTHTEADHTQFTNHNALGGQLHAAGPPIHRAENIMRARAISDSDNQDDVRQVSNSNIGPQPFSMQEKKTTHETRTTRSKRAVAVLRQPRIGSAAADWSRWPQGTTFRLLSTGQIYRVDDYGWALSGRNTIDLYMATSREMNNWGARQEPIQILQWGSTEESLRLLIPHQNHKHIRRMVYELQGNDKDAAALQ